MKKHTYIIIGIVAVILLSFFAFKLNWFSGKNKQKDTIVDGKEKSVFPLKTGSVGAEVLQLQKKLNEKATTYKILQLLIEDGIFGKLTEGMLFNFYNTRVCDITLYNKI